MLKPHTADPVGLSLTPKGVLASHPEVVIKQKPALVKVKILDFASLSLQHLSPFSDLKVLPKHNHKATLKYHRNV